MRLAYDHERRCLALDYYGALYPLNPATYAAIPRGGNAVLERIAAIAGTAERKTAAQFHAEIAAVVATPSLAAELDRYLARLSADKQQLGRLHRMQSWQLMNWRVARDKLSYRRFFEIAGLVGMRVEDEGVFADTHRLTLALVREGLVDGLRIDHIDGLADPKGYLDRLREETGDGTYIIVEKILAENETLPAGWPVEGTTGYEFISALADLLSDDTPSSWLSSEERRSAAEAAVTGCKLQVLGRNFNTEVRRLTGLVARFTGNGVPDRDEQTGEAIRRLIAALPVYRTYVGDQGAGARDSRILDGIAAKAAARAPAAGDETATIISAFTAPIDSLGGKLPAEFRTRFQQLSGAVMAKAVEDTFFYRRGDYLAANEVGASPLLDARRRRPLPCDDAGPRKPDAVRPIGDVHARHQTGRGRPRAALRHQRGIRRLGRSDGALARDECREHLPAAGRRRAGGLGRAISLSESARRLADRSPW